LGATGSVSFLFDRLGQIDYDLKVGDFDKVLEAAIEAGAQDVETDAGDGDEDPGAHIIYTAFEDLNAVAESLSAQLGDPKATKFVWKPKSLTPISGDQARTLIKLLDVLNDDDDVQTVFGDFEFDEADLNV